MTLNHKSLLLKFLELSLLTIRPQTFSIGFISGAFAGKSNFSINGWAENHSLTTFAVWMDELS